jgi:predicted metalloprotease with PDZ domain
VLLRRAGLQDSAAARATFESALGAWQGNPAVTRLSPERSSYTAWDSDTINGGDALSYYTQGEVLGELLDLALRARTGGRATFADVMRRLSASWSGARGFTPVDVWRAVDETCGCALSPVFRPHVEFAAPLPLDALLAAAGWRLVGEPGAPVPDRRVGAVGWAGYGSAGGEAGGPIRLRIGDRESAWGRAGLASGDEILAVDGERIPSPDAFSARIARVSTGDVVRVTVRRGADTLEVAVAVGTWQPTRFRLEDLPMLTPAQRQLRAAWASGR